MPHAQQQLGAAECPKAGPSVRFKSLLLWHKLSQGATHECP